jgi:ABC-type multidrug transport system fused ATPase/permease subunit
VPADRTIVTTKAADGKNAWPDKGAVTFENVNMRYRAGLPLVLKDLSLEIGGGLRVGVCGRSGSGKSSLLVALFRLTNVEPTGRILIDGVDIASLSLQQLRRTVGIIPQDPVLFVGTLRDNLDAFGEHEDSALWDALR